MQTAVYAMRVLLGSCPFHSRRGPPLGLASLKAALAEQGPDLAGRTVDLNLGFFRGWLLGDPPNLCGAHPQHVLAQVCPALLVRGRAGRGPGAPADSHAARAARDARPPPPARPRPEQLGELEEALAAYGRAELRDWYEPEINVAQARCLGALGRRSEAQSALTKAGRKERVLADLADGGPATGGPV